MGPLGRGRVSEVAREGGRDPGKRGEHGYSATHTALHIVTMTSSVVVVAPPSVHRLGKGASGWFVVAAIRKHLNKHHTCNLHFSYNILPHSMHVVSK